MKPTIDELITGLLRDCPGTSTKKIRRYVEGPLGHEVQWDEIEETLQDMAQAEQIFSKPYGNGKRWLLVSD